MSINFLLLFLLKSQVTIICIHVTENSSPNGKAASNDVPLELNFNATTSTVPSFKSSPPRARYIALIFFPSLAWSLAFRRGQVPRNGGPYSAPKESTHSRCQCFSRPGLQKIPTKVLVATHAMLPQKSRLIDRIADMSCCALPCLIRFFLTVL